MKPALEMSSSEVAAEATDFLFRLAKGDKTIRRILAALPNVGPDINEQVATLISWGANVNDNQDLMWNTPLMAAASRGDTEMVIALIERGEAQIDFQDSAGWTALMVAALTGRYPDTILALIQRGAEVNTLNVDRGLTALMLVAGSGEEKMIRALINAGARINQQGKGGETALMRVATNPHIESVLAILAAGAKVNLADQKGKTALMVASGAAKKETIKALIAAGADVNFADQKGNTALIMATRNFIIDNGLIASIMVLILAGAEINHANSQGETALTIATARNPRLVLAITLARILREAEQSGTIAEWHSFQVALSNSAEIRQALGHGILARIFLYTTIDEQGESLRTAIINHFNATGHLLHNSQKFSKLNELRELLLQKPEFNTNSYDITKAMLALLKNNNISTLANFYSTSRNPEARQFRVDPAERIKEAREAVNRKIAEDELPGLSEQGFSEAVEKKAKQMAAEDLAKQEFINCPQSTESQLINSQYINTTFFNYSGLTSNQNSVLATAVKGFFRMQNLAAIESSTRQGMAEQEPTLEVKREVESSMIKETSEQAVPQTPSRENEAERKPEGRTEISGSKKIRATEAARIAAIRRAEQAESESKSTLFSSSEATQKQQTPTTSPEQTFAAGLQAESKFQTP